MTKYACIIAPPGKFTLWSLSHVNFPHSSQYCKVSWNFALKITDPIASVYQYWPVYWPFKLSYIKLSLVSKNSGILEKNFNIFINLVYAIQWIENDIIQFVINCFFTTRRLIRRSLRLPKRKWSQGQGGL